MGKKGLRLTIIMVLVLTGVSAGGYSLLRQGVTPTSLPARNDPYSDSFRFSVPKPYGDLTLYQLPNTFYPRNVVQYGSSLWFAANGSLVEYDTKSRKIVAYTDMTKANCDSNVAIANNFLFVACHVDDIEFASRPAKQPAGSVHEGQYAVFKIDPIKHVVKRLFSIGDGLLNGYNYRLFPDGDHVWVTTFKGIGGIDARSDRVTFIDGYDASGLFVDKDYVWASPLGGLAVFEKKTETWKSFWPSDLKDHKFDRSNLEREAIKAVPGGVQIAFRDGQVDVDGGSYDRLVEKRYDYGSGKWTKVSEQPTTGKYCETASQFLIASYPSTDPYQVADGSGLRQLSPPATFDHKIVDSSGLTQLKLPNSSDVYQLDGRNNYLLSPFIENKRYVLTSATVDVIEDSSPFPTVLVKLGSRLTEEYVSSFPRLPEDVILFLVDPSSLLAVVADYLQQRVWFIDLKAVKVKRAYSRADGIRWSAIGMNWVGVDYGWSKKPFAGVSLGRDGSLLVVKNKDGQALFTIDTTNNSLSFPNATPDIATILSSMAPQMPLATVQPVKSPSPLATPAATEQPIMPATKTYSASYEQLTDKSGDSGAAWIDDDTVRFYRYVDEKSFIGEAKIHSGDARLFPIEMGEKGGGFYWSPQKKFLLITGGAFYDPTSLWLYETSSGKTSEIALPVLVTDTWDIGWTPDESSLLFLMAGEEISAYARNMDPTLLIRVDVKTLQVVEFGNLPPLFRWFSLSPKGDQIIFLLIQGAPGGDGLNLRSLLLSTGELRELPMKGKYHVRWSPDGEQFAFGAQRTPEGRSIMEADQAIWVAPRDGESAKRVVASQSDFQWLPDGKHLLLADLTLVDVDSGEISVPSFPPGQTLPEVRQLGPIFSDGKKMLVETAAGLGMVTFGK